MELEVLLPGASEGMILFPSLLVVIGGMGGICEL